MNQFFFKHNNWKRRIFKKFYFQFLTVWSNKIATALLQVPYALSDAGALTYTQLVIP